MQIERIESLKSYRIFKKNLTLKREVFKVEFSKKTTNLSIRTEIVNAICPNNVSNSPAIGTAGSRRAPFKRASKLPAALKCILDIDQVNVSGATKSKLYSTGGQYLETYALK